MLAVALVARVACGHPFSGAAAHDGIHDWLWQHVLFSADFVGVVECDVAGVLLMEGRSSRVWKGDVPVGQPLRIRLATIPGEERDLPFALKGERYLVAGFGVEGSGGSVGSTDDAASGGRGGQAVPKWTMDCPAYWRALPHHYRTVTWGLARIPPEGSPSRVLHGFGRIGADVDEFLEEVGGFLDLPPNEQWDVLRASIANRVQRMDSHDRARVEVGPRVAVPRRLLERRAWDEAGDGKEILEEARAFWFSWPCSEGDFYTPPELDERDLDRYEETLKDGAHQPLSHGLVSCLVEQRPRVVASALVSRARHGVDDSTGYAACAYLLTRTLDRSGPAVARGMCQELMGSDDPFVAVTAACYLALLDDDGRGADTLQHFRRSVDLDGDAGVLAALGLVRRGESQYVPRMLRVFADAGAEPLHGWLKARCAALLSNAEGVGRLSDPVLLRDLVVGRSWRADSGDPELPTHSTDPRAMWDRAAERARIADPWMAELKERMRD